MGTSGLGTLLVDEGLLSETDRRTIKRTCGSQGPAFARSILAMGLLDEHELAAFLAERTNWRLAAKDLLRETQEEAWGSIDRPLLERLEVLPLRLEGQTLHVAVVDPLDRDTLAQLEFFTGYKIHPVISTLSQIRKGLKKLFKDYEPPSSQLEDFLSNHVTTASRRLRVLSGRPSNPAHPKPQASTQAKTDSKSKPLVRQSSPLEEDLSVPELDESNQNQTAEDHLEPNDFASQAGSESSSDVFGPSDLSADAELENAFNAAGDDPSAIGLGDGGLADIADTTPESDKPDLEELVDVGAKPETAPSDASFQDDELSNLKFDESEMGDEPTNPKLDELANEVDSEIGAEATEAADLTESDPNASSALAAPIAQDLANETSSANHLPTDHSLSAATDGTSTLDEFSESDTLESETPDKTADDPEALDSLNDLIALEGDDSGDADIPDFSDVADSEPAPLEDVKPLDLAGLEDEVSVLDNEHLAPAAEPVEEAVASEIDDNQDPAGDQRDQEAVHDTGDLGDIGDEGLNKNQPPVPMVEESEANDDIIPDVIDDDAVVEPTTGAMVVETTAELRDAGGDESGEAIGRTAPFSPASAALNRALLGLTLAFDFDQALQRTLPALVQAGLKRGLVFDLTDSAILPLHYWEERKNELHEESRGDQNHLGRFVGDGLQPALTRLYPGWNAFTEIARGSTLKPFASWRDADSTLLAAMAAIDEQHRLVVIAAWPNAIKDDASLRQVTMDIVRKLAKKCVTSE